MEADGCRCIEPPSPTRKAAPGQARYTRGPICSATWMRASASHVSAPRHRSLVVPTQFPALARQIAMREIESRRQGPIGFLKSHHLLVLSINLDSSKTRLVMDSANAIVEATPGWKDGRRQTTAPVLGCQILMPRAPIVFAYGAGLPRTDVLRHSQSSHSTSSGQALRD